MADAAGFTVEDAPPSEGDDERIARLAKLPLLDYERIRQPEAEALNCRASILDKLVQQAREPSGADEKQGRALTIAAPEPWPEPVDGSSVLDALAAFFARHLALPPGARDALAAWALHTHVYQHGRHTPRLAITSPEKGCGKTTVLDLLNLVVSKALSTANITTAAVFRTVELAAPTLLVDEADTFLANSDDLRGVLNAGHKAGGQVIRCVGDDAEVRQFNVFAPAAIAAIGRLPGTIADRSITITMRRATPREPIEPMRRPAEQEGATLARKAARWAADHGPELVDTDPALPPTLANRAADNWRPLFAIAALAGGEWPARLVTASAALSNDDGREGLGVALLRDVRAVFADAGVEKLATAVIVARLIEMEDRPWPEVSQGKPLTATRFTRMVNDFGAKRTRWREGADSPWGFALASFADAFTRYLPDTPSESGNNRNSVETLSVATSSEVGAGCNMIPHQTTRKAAEKADVPIVPTFNGGAGVWEATL